MTNRRDVLKTLAAAGVFALFVNRVAGAAAGDTKKFWTMSGDYPTRMRR
jgi:hypothetical protein